MISSCLHRRIQFCLGGDDNRIHEYRQHGQLHGLKFFELCHKSRESGVGVELQLSITKSPLVLLVFRLMDQHSIQEFCQLISTPISN
ncbi:hypothetical protein TNIN_430501 [Trichonephila inaurata madagascariensis]|uniref:Uncharacterized protein n=1 Tax=Trichonephila inaurata madagascariensis TaxID=2747483 RepID=A0A8X7CGB7_9ARAC|nr:hypothetical protein TNIN_430501 [Trichonephila inaurata madagascariensis]